MPSNFGSQHGSFAIIEAVPTVDQPLPTGLVIDAAGQYLGERIRAEGLPQVNLWILQSAGGAGVSATVQFEQLPDAWYNITAPIALAPGTPTLVNKVLGSANYRVKIDNGGGAAATVFYRISATLPG